MGGQQIGMVAFKAWVDFLSDLKSQRSKKKERAEGVMKRFANEQVQLQIAVLQGWGGFVQKRRARIEKVSNQFMAEGKMLLQLVVQTWFNDVAENKKNKKDKEEQRAALI